MQPLEATGRGSRLLVLAALLVLLPAPGSVAKPPRLVWKESPLSRRGWVDASSPTVQRAAQTAVNYFNYKEGSPSALRAPGPVRKASLKLIPGLGRKYFLQFATKDLKTGENLGTCDASVFYMKNKPTPAVEISCSPNQDRSKQLMQDDLLFLRLTDKEPPAELQWRLAVYGSSRIAWDAATEDLAYTLTDIKNVKPWKTGDRAPEFDYTVLLGDRWGESPMLCHMRVAWKPRLPVKVKYSCSLEDASSESADGSGGELGSASEYYTEVENNF